MTPKVLIGMPVGNHIEPGAMESFEEAAALHPDEGYASSLRVVAYRATNQARNKLAAMTLEGDWTHLWMLDDDMTYPSGCLARLLFHNKDIIAPFYVRKVRGYLPNAFVRNTEGLWKTQWVDDLQQVAACGTGGMLIARRVFEIVPAPWFEYEPYDEPHLSKYKVEQKTEDVVFCERAVKAGIDIWVDGTLKCGHIGAFIVVPGHQYPDNPEMGVVNIHPYEPLDRMEAGYGY